MKKAKAKVEITLLYKLQVMRKGGIIGDIGYFFITDNQSIIDAALREERESKKNLHQCVVPCRAVRVGRRFFVAVENIDNFVGLIKVVNPTQRIPRELLVGIRLQKKADWVVLVNGNPVEVR